MFALVAACDDDRDCFPGRAKNEVSMVSRTDEPLSLCVVALAVLMAGCGKKKTKIAAPAPGLRSAPAGVAAPPVGAPPVGAPPVGAPPVGTTERGIASWYGHPYHGRAAADGEIYDMETMVAAASNACRSKHAFACAISATTRR